MLDAGIEIDLGKCFAWLRVGLLFKWKLKVGMPFSWE